jgi:glycosyltransferase involved in cell wall biosynthesis
VYSSSADRGLDALLAMWPRIRAEVPDAELHVFYGFNTLDAIAIHNPNLAAFKLAILKKVDELGGETGGVFLRGRVGQVELADEMMQATVLAYPTAFLETSCITAMEARAAGLPIVASGLGALNETVGDHGILIPWGPDEDEACNTTGEYQDRFIDQTVTMLKSEQSWHAVHERGLENIDEVDWDNRIDVWENLIDGNLDSVVGFAVIAAAV